MDEEEEEVMLEEEEVVQTSLVLSMVVTIQYEDFPLSMSFGRF